MNPNRIIVTACLIALVLLALWLVALATVRREAKPTTQHGITPPAYYGSKQ